MAGLFTAQTYLQNIFDVPLERQSTLSLYFTREFLYSLHVLKQRTVLQIML